MFKKKNKQKEDILRGTENKLMFQRAAKNKVKQSRKYQINLSNEHVMQLVLRNWINLQGLVKIELFLLYHAF